MKKILNKKIIVSISLFTISLTNFAQENINNSITFIQGDSVYKINNKTDLVNLERKPFSIRYFSKPYDSKNHQFYSVQVAILQDPIDTLILKTGQNTENISYFEPGTGMAPGSNGMYDTIVITNTAHHYLTYENENDKKVYLISENKDNLELEWKISAAYYEEKDVQFIDLKLSTLYFVFFIDNNLNGIIENGELKTVITKLK